MLRNRIPVKSYLPSADPVSDYEWYLMQARSYPPGSARADQLRLARTALTRIGLGVPVGNGLDPRPLTKERRESMMQVLDDAIAIMDPLTD